LLTTPTLFGPRVADGNERDREATKDLHQDADAAPERGELPRLKCEDE
jgi:hypothetical protein